ncbi:MAG: sel1 repeat family protein [Alphaproteobacteria bacterium]|nr:sel1 repeat family protein [Alphaproteobacteria bacterium]
MTPAQVAITAFLVVAPASLGAVHAGDLVPQRASSEEMATLRAAAEAGDAAAQHKFGMRLVESSARESDPEEGVRWLKRAAAQSYLPAMYDLAVAYYQGTGADRDYAEAARWFEAAAHRGHGPAAFNLGAMYDDGLGVARDRDKAVVLLTQAAREGVPEAMHTIGSLLAEESRTDEDLIEALKWLLLAEALDDGDIEQDLLALYGRLPQSSRQEGGRRAREWLRR